MVALAPTFQSEAGVPYEEAVNNVFFIEARSQVFPRAVISVMSGSETQVAGGDASYSRPGVMLHLYLAVGPDDTFDDRQDQQLKGIDTLAKILAETMSLAGVDDPEEESSHLNVLRRETSVFDETPEELWNNIDELGTELGQYYWCETVIEVGD